MKQLKQLLTMAFLLTTMLAFGQTGKPLVIREDTKVIVAETLERMPGRGVYPGRSMGFSDSNEEENEKDSEIQFQKIKLTSNIYVKFLIK